MLYSLLFYFFLFRLTPAFVTLAKRTRIDCIRVCIVYFLAATSKDTSKNMPKRKNIFSVCLFYNSLFIIIFKPKIKFSFFFFLAVDLYYGNILCFQCGDYVYDRELLAVAKSQRSESAKSLSLGEFYRSWEPTPQEVDLLKKNPRRRRVVENSTIGLCHTHKIFFIFIYLYLIFYFVICKICMKHTRCFEKKFTSIDDAKKI